MPVNRERLLGSVWSSHLQQKPHLRRYGPTRTKALVCKWEDGAMEVYYREERIASTELKKPPRYQT
jgi:hypothetical protein